MAVVIMKPVQRALGTMAGRELCRDVNAPGGCKESRCTKAHEPQEVCRDFNTARGDKRKRYNKVHEPRPVVARRSTKL